MKENLIRHHQLLSTIKHIPLLLSSRKFISLPDTFCCDGAFFRSLQFHCPSSRGGIPSESWPCGADTRSHSLLPSSAAVASPLLLAGPRCPRLEGEAQPPTPPTPAVSGDGLVLRLEPSGKPRRLSTGCPKALLVAAAESSAHGGTCAHRGPAQPRPTKPGPAGLGAGMGPPSSPAPWKATLVPHKPGGGSIYLSFKQAVSL